VPVHVVDACGASVATGHVMTGGVPVPENAVSVALTPVRSVLPVLVTWKEYVTVWPADVTADGEAVFNTDSDGAAVAVTVAVDGFDVTAGPVGGVPDAVAVSMIEPPSTSACVTVYVPVQVVDAPGAKVVTGHVMTGGVPVPENAVSVAPTPVNVALPVLVTWNEYVTV
jgi:YbbR domain-containing protein